MLASINIVPEINMETLKDKRKILNSVCKINEVMPTPKSDPNKID